MQTDTQPSAFVVHLSHPMMQERRSRRRRPGGNVEWYRGKKTIKERWSSADPLPQACSVEIPLLSWQRAHCKERSNAEELCCVKLRCVVQNGNRECSLPKGNFVYTRQIKGAFSLQLYIIPRPSYIVYGGITKLAIIYFKLSLIHSVFLCLSANSNHGQRRCVFRLSVNPILVDGDIPATPW